MVCREFLMFTVWGIGKLLGTLGIKASKPHKDQIKTKANGEKVISMRIWIAGRENLRKTKYLNIIHPLREKFCYNIIKIIKS